MARLGLLIALGAAACNGAGAGADGGAESDADPGGCLPDGSGVVNGSVLGAAIAPVVRAFQLTTALGVVIAVDEQPGDCGTVSSTGEHLALLFCVAPTPGIRALVDEQTFTCPGSDAAAVVEQNGATDLAEATGGTVTISAVSDDCVSGSFSASFADEILAGSFDAVICP